jgi:hypothetical protein
VVLFVEDHLATIQDLGAVKATTSQAQWIHHRPSASTQLGNLCSLTRDCPHEPLPVRRLWPGLIRLVESKEFREIKFRDEDAFDIKAGCGQKLKLVCVAPSSRR